METVKGSCLCEAVTFEVQGEPENVMQCFCQHCAKNAGAPYQNVAKFKVEQVQVTDAKGARKTYVLKDTLSGHDKHKVFCGDCGCTLWTIPMRHGGSHYVVRTSLIDNGLTLFPPKVVFFAGRDQSSTASSDLKRFPTMPGF